jgi:hypothetical protein
MNTVILQQRIDDVISLLRVSDNEAQEIEAKRAALEKQAYALSDREKSIYTREVEYKKKIADIEAQKIYIEEQSKNAQLTLNKLVLERDALKGLVKEKEEIERERTQLEADKKSFETLKLEKEEFIKERDLFKREKLAMQESQKLLSIREANITAKEERLDKIERMTQM